MHLSHLYEDVEAWYLNFDYPERVSTTFKPGLDVEEGTQTVHQDAEDVDGAKAVEQDAERYDAVGHSSVMQPASRLQEDVTGNVSYDPENHDLMTRLRAAKVAGIAADIPELAVDDPDGADTLVLGWGSTYGAIGAAARRVRASGRKVATAHLQHLNPFPRNTGEVVQGYEKILIPELNMGQLRLLIRAQFLVDAAGYNKVRGRPFRAAELADAITALVDS